MKRFYAIMIIFLVQKINGSDNLNWLIYKDEKIEFKYPAALNIDPLSYGGNDVKNKFFEEYKWSVLVNQKDKNKLRFSVMIHGFVSSQPKMDNMKENLSSGGFSNARDVFLVDNLSSPTHRITKNNFEIFIMYRKEKIIVYFLKKNPDWGLAYNLMVFDNVDNKDDKSIVKKIIDSYKPSFVAEH